MELKMGLGESGIQLPSSTTLSSKSCYKVGGGGKGPRWKRIHFNNSHNLSLFLALLLFSLTSSRILSVEGSNEIESCARLMHSEHNPNSGASAIGHQAGHGKSIGSSSTSTNGRLLTGNGNNFQGSSSTNNNVGGSANSVICQIRTLRPELDIENLTSSIPSGNGGTVDVMTITKLKLVCNDVLFFESGVSPGQLSALSELQSVTIENCKIKHLPADFLSGLRHLRKITINTGNSEWAARTLEISPGAFSAVPHLHSLGLGYNNLWSLPERLLCQVGSLQILNLTHNLLSDIDDLGIPGLANNGRMLPLLNEYSNLRTTPFPVVDGCLGDLKSLDLSYNSLRTLGSRRLERMRRLISLQLSYNWLEELEDDAFSGLDQIRKLNLSSNRLVALPSKLFNSCKLIQELTVSNNSLTAIAPGLLDGLEHLQILDFSMNSLTSQWINSESFKSLVRLVILNLSSNQLTHLAPSTFNDLYSLQILDISNNLISSIDDNTFSKMTNLHSLNLGKNRLKIITPNMFNGLYVMHKLILDYNHIGTIENEALKNCTSLDELLINNNNLTEIPKALRGLQRLKTLDLGENRLSTLNNESFQGMSQLYGLRLVGQLIEEIPKGLCDPIPRLRVFNIAQNKINKISPTGFVSCPELRVLRLDANKLDSIPTTLAPQLPNLLWLNVSENQIRQVHYSMLPSTLEWFDVSYNRLENLGGAWPQQQQQQAANRNAKDGNSRQNQNQSPSNQNAHLRVVDVSHNLLSELSYDSVPASLEILRLSYNRLKKILPDTFSHSVHLRRVELISNQLEDLSLNSLRLPPIPLGKPIPEFLIAGNAFACTCNMEWLTRINQLSALRQHPTVLDLDSIVCRVSYSRTVTHVPLPDMKPQDFLCPYKSHCFALCTCCDFEFCDCAMECPSNCTCFHDDNWSANVVDCANTGVATIPSRLPMDSTEVYLDGNNIPTLKSHIFIGRKNLKILFLNSSNIETINNKSFNGLLSLHSLHLENNKLKVLQGYEFDHLTKLRELYLHDNMLSSISNTTFLPLKSLEILSLDGNRLIQFTVWQLSLNPYLVEIGLARNQWNCDCQFLHQLYGWAIDNSRKVVDLGQLQCVWNTTHKPGPHLIDYNRTCGSAWARMDGDFYFTFSPLPLIFGCVSLVILLIIVIIAVILCRDNMRLWIFSHFGIRMCTSEFDDEKLYDSYLIFGEKDEFVAQKIADELETNDSYRLCLHYRDLISESGDLKDVMVDAVENSKSVVVILSRNFLQGEWVNGEYRGAFHAVLKKSQKHSRDGKKVVIVFIDDINPMEVSPDIRSWIRHNRIQVIKWSLTSLDQRKHKKFWSKLKYSLPAPSSHYHSNITSNTTTTSASSGESNVGGIMATLKYSANNENEQQIIVDELNRSMAMNINNKLWPYASNLVALPPKYQIPNSPGNYSQTGTIQSHLSLNNYNQSIHSQSSPAHHYNLHQTTAHHQQYHPPLPLSHPPKSPPSSQSTDSTTTNGGDESLHTPTSFSLMFQQMQQLQQQNNKSPVPVPKSLYSSSSVNNGVLNNSNSHSSGGNSGGGESYLSLEGEHVYSTLDPPSPQQTTATNNRLLNNIHLPNGYTYQPQIQANSSPQATQWHPTQTPPTPKAGFGGNPNKTYKQAKNDNNPVQTYLV